MGISCEDDTTDTEEYSIQLAEEEIEEETQNVSSVVMDAHNNNNNQVDEIDMEFWPLEHPMEPPDEDHPLKYPMPDSAAINGGHMHERRLGRESMWRKSDASSEMNKKGKFLTDPAPAVRAVRKRHHTTLTQGDIIITPLRTIPPQETKSGITIFQMLQQLDTFEP